MQRDHRLLIVRISEGEIPLEKWLSVLATSAFVLAEPPKAFLGTNPFTRKPHTFYSGPGGAFFDGPSGRCEIEYHAGGSSIAADLF
jgi:hypothetical protein